MTAANPVSVRFPAEELRRIRALAVIYGTTKNAVIREACAFYLDHQASEPACRQVTGDYRRRAAGVAGVPGDSR